MAEPMVQDRVRPRSASSGQRPRRRGIGESVEDAYPRGFRATLERIVLGVLTTLVSVNIWTGGPVLALWVGSRVQVAVGSLSMAAVGATIGALGAITFVLYQALALLTARYNTVIGRVVPRRQAAWLKPMSGERRSLEVKRPLSAPERIVVASAVAAALAFEVWFFFFAHYTFAS